MKRSKDKQDLNLDIVKQDPDVVKQDPDMGKQDPDKVKQDPDKVEEDPDMGKQDPDMGKQDPDKVKQNPDKVEEDPDMVKQAPDMFRGVHGSILEAFDNLDWSDNVSPNFFKYFLPPEEKSESHAIKLIKSEKAVICAKEIKLPPIRENEISLYIPGLKPTYQLCLPKPSILNGREQGKLFGFYCRMMYKNNFRPLSESELTEFQMLRAKAAGECAEFQEFAKTEWYKGQFKRTLFIPPQVEHYIDSLWKMRAGQCLAGYPDDYKGTKQIPLVLHDPNADYSVMDFVKNVHSQGMPPKMRFQKINKPIEVITSFEDLTRMKPVSGDCEPKPFYKPASAVSFDHVIEDLLKKEDLDVDVVISMSGIKTLVDNVKFQREWILPVTVKDILKNDGETLKRVVMIDKNLPPKSLSVHEKNLWHAKVVAKWLLVQNEYQNLFEKKEETHNFKKGFQSPCKVEENFEDMLSDVVEQIKEEKYALQQDSNSEQLPGETAHAKPLDPEEQQLQSKTAEIKCSNEVRPERHKVISLQENSPNTRTKDTGGSAAPDVFFFGATENPTTDKSATKVENKPAPLAQPTLSQKQQTKPRMTLRSSSLWTNFNKKGPSFPPGQKTMKREGQSLISYDDPFSDCVAEEIEEFGVNPIPQKEEKTKDIKQEEGECRISRVEGNPASKEIKEEEMFKGCVGKLSTDIKVEESPNPNIDKRSYVTFKALRRGNLQTCVQYDLWNLHKSRINPFLKIEQRPLNILVRTRKDGKLFHIHNNQNQLTDVCVSSKLEFQPDYGAWKMAASELTREYLDLYMRPNSKLVRVRSVGHTKELMLTELKTLSEIRDALQAETCGVQKVFDPLYAVLTKLIDLMPGRYMLQHTVKMGSFATLYEEKPGWMSLQLPQYLSEMVKADVNVPPMPIDPLVITALQHRDRMPPALFKPGFINKSAGKYFRKPAPVLQVRAKKKKTRKTRRKKTSVKSEDDSDSVYSVDLSQSVTTCDVHFF